MTQVGTVYGQALYTLAQEENLSEQILQQLTLLQECFDAEPEYMQLLSCVAIPKPERCQLLDESMGSEVHPYLLNFLKILVEKGKGMEINSSGVDRAGDFLPSADFLRRFKELGGEIVTIGSDSHVCKRGGQYSDKMLCLLESIFGHVCTFDKRKVIFRKL